MTLVVEGEHAETLSVFYALTDPYQPGGTKPLTHKDTEGRLRRLCGAVLALAEDGRTVRARLSDEPALRLLAKLAADASYRGAALGA